MGHDSGLCIYKGIAKEEDATQIHIFSRQGEEKIKKCSTRQVSHMEKGEKNSWRASKRADKHLSGTGRADPAFGDRLGNLLRSHPVLPSLIPRTNITERGKKLHNKFSAVWGDITSSLHLYPESCR